MDYAGSRFRRRFIGYDKNSVDAEFEKLINQVDDALDKNDELRQEIQELREERRDWEYAKRTLEDERTAMSRDRAALAESVSSISGKVAELETSLSSAKVANEALQNKIDATASERNELQLRLNTVQERNRELTLRERQFDEIEKSVSSIMSVTKRATDRLFQKSVENQENVIRIAGDAAQEAALIRADLTAARDDMNLAFDEFQDRIDKIDASLTGAVHKLVAIKHDSGLKPKNADATIESEVERLLSMRAGEVDYSDGKGYAVPVLGPYSAKFISDAAKKVNSGEIDGHPSYENHATGTPPHMPPGGAAPDDDGEKAPVSLKRSYPTVFESNDDSIKEANRLLDDADEAAERRSAPQPAPAPQSQPVYQPYQQPVYQPYPSQPYAPPQYAVQPPRQNPIGFGYADEEEQESVNPYSDSDYEQVDISTLGNTAPTINMNSTDLQYLQPSAPDGVFDAPPMTVNMERQQSGTNAGYVQAAAPTFVPDAPVISADAPQTEQNVPASKRVSVKKHVRIVSADRKEKVAVTLRHGK